MGRPKKTDTNEAVSLETVENEVMQNDPEVNEVPNVEDTEEDGEASASEKQSSSKSKAKDDLPANIEKLMRLYPQYE